MHKIHTYIKLSFVALFVASMATFFTGADAYAETGDKNCEVDTGIISCDSRLDESGNVKEGIEGTGLWSVLLLGLNILVGGVGIASVGGVVYASSLYASAGGNQEKVKKAGSLISSIVIGVIAFAFMWSLLNFLIPGGAFAN